jgi:hypothetical protein
MLPRMPIGAPLQGVTRPRGVATPDEDTSGGRRRVEPPPTTGDAAGRLLAIAAELRARVGANTLARRWQFAVQANMTHKQKVYTNARDAMEAEVDDQQSVVASFVRAARGGGKDALADAQTANWDVAEKVSGRWQSLVLQSASYERLIRRARERHDAMNNATDFAFARAELALAIERLATDFRTQHVLLDAIGDVIDAFIRNPLVSSGAFLNVMLMGRPGVGKTRLATSLASVMGRLGLGDGSTLSGGLSKSIVVEATSGRCKVTSLCGALRRNAQLRWESTRGIWTTRVCRRPSRRAMPSRSSAKRACAKSKSALASR